MSRLILVRGLPGSGKSTYARSLEIYHVEADMFCMIDGKYVFDRAKHRKNHELCRRLVWLAIEHGCDCVVSNTFTQQWEMQPYLDVAKEFGCSVEVVKMVGDFGTIHNVPEEAIKMMKDRWEDHEGELCCTNKQARADAGEDDK